MGRTARLVFVILGAVLSIKDVGANNLATRREARSQVDAFGREVLSPSGERRRYAFDPHLSSARHPRGRPGGPRTRTLDSPGTAAPSALAPASGTDLPVELEWHQTIFGVGIGATGLIVADLDGDGRPEIVAGAGPSYFWGNSFWYVLSYRDGEYRPVFVNNPYPDAPYPHAIAAIRVARVPGETAPLIVVAEGRNVYLYDGATRALRGTIATATFEIGSLAVADVDGDGDVELVLSDSQAFQAPDLYVYDLASGALEWKGAGLGGRDVAVGNVDDDAHVEIVVGNGTATGYVIDGSTHAVKWANFWGFGDHVGIGDVDGDGRVEIVSGYQWDGIKIFRARDQTYIRSVPVSLNLDALRLIDVNGDGRPEIVSGDGQWGSIHVFDGATGAERWSIPNPEHGVTDVAFGDVDGDGTPEILWGAGYSSTGPDHLYVYDAVTRAREWQSPDLVGPFSALSYGDVDGDGDPELLYGSISSDSGYGDGRFFIHDARTKALEFASPLGNGLDWEGLRRIRNASVNGDPRQRIFVTTSDIYTPLIVCYDGLTRVEQWRVRGEDGLRFDSLEVVDLDGDGRLELVAGTGRAHTGASGVYVYVYDAATGAFEWRSPDLDRGFSSLALLRIADVDGDGRLEILVGDILYSGATGLYRIDPVSHTVRALGLHDTTALATPDRNGDGKAEIIIGTRQGEIQVLDPATGAVAETIGSYGARIDGLNVVDVTGDGSPDYVFAMDNRLYVYDGRSGLGLWSSPVIGIGPGGSGDGVGANDSLVVADVDGDGRPEIFVNIGATGVQVYEVRAGLAVAQTGPPDPVELGDPLTYTFTVSNLDAIEATDAALVDFLPAGVGFVSMDTSEGVCARGANQVVCNLGTLAAGAQATIHIRVTAQQAEATLVNTAVVSRAEPDPFLANKTSVHTTHVLSVLTMSARSTSIEEPLTGLRPAVVEVSLSRPSIHDVSVNYATADGTATARADYLPVTGTLVFPRGTVSRKVVVPILADALRERSETLFVNLSGASLGEITGGASVTILDRRPRVRTPPSAAR